MNGTPAVTVLMSVYNTKDEYLKEAIDSILAQSFSDFEFIIIDDNTCASNLKTLSNYTDPRIRIIHNEKNLGLTESLYNGVNLARGKYIARMDSDDVSCPDRLERQVEFLEKNPSVAVVGAAAKFMNSDKIVIHVINDEETLKLRSIFINCVMAHPTAMINAEILCKSNINYDRNIKKAQDYMLWTDCMLNGLRLRIIDEILVLYRVHDGQISKTSSAEQCNYAKKIQRKIIKRYFDYDMSNEETDIHFGMLKNKLIGDIKEYENHIWKLLDKNENTKTFEKKDLYRECCYIWIYMTVRNIIKYKCFSGLFSIIFWKAISRVDFWKYYFENTIGNIIKERKMIKEWIN